MTNSQIPEDPGLSQESWRPKFYGLIQEGRKARVSQSALKIGLLVLGLLILGSQFMMSWETTGKIPKEVAIRIPQIGVSSNSVYVPPVTNSVKEREVEKAQERAARQARLGPMKIEPIKTINLAQVKDIPSGSEVMALLSSGASNGLVKAVLTNDLKYNGDVLLPKGSVLIGKGSSSEERLYIQFTKAIAPDKGTLKIKAFAFDGGDRIIGLKGKKISDYAFKLAASAGLIFLGGAADGLREDYSSNPFDRRKPTVRDAALNGVSTATVETGKDMMNDLKTKESRVEVASSTQILVIFGDVE
jgi:hypothetical protein